jgi:hypothetical protein
MTRSVVSMTQPRTPCIIAGLDLHEGDGCSAANIASCGQRSKGKATHCSVYSVSMASVILCSLALSVFDGAQAHAGVSNCSHISTAARAHRGTTPRVGCQTLTGCVLGCRETGWMEFIPPTS